MQLNVKMRNFEIIKGACVTVYTDPITLQRWEGNAKVIRVIRKEDWNDIHGHPIYRCIVRFYNERNTTYERDVSILAGVSFKTLEKP